MKKLFFFLFICIFKIWTEKAKASKFISLKKKKNANSIEVNHLNNREHTNYSFLMNKKENDDEKEDKDHNLKKDKEGDENNSNERKHEEENSNEKKHEENSNEKSNDDNSLKKKDEHVPVEKKINKENLLEYGTHDNDGNFIPSYKTLTDEILSTNNSMERASSFLKIACSHILKILEFVPESKLSSQYIKVESKTVYLKELGIECQNIYFSLEKLSMSVIVLNSKINKLIYVTEK
ncbi:conserved Plasmodium protein, unknown function [Plasmodium relictum]|uniref:Rhoptry associated adhesin n=1 Tax=Plasmodium relictum TaxID=85471 RepID=A0A1J1H546_PLARL|nr:conserved Plasmodium protein, unknown function [Plasmodium relictum]CRG99675.1 conserved Plasmodium protein, unknown function [Plasmodium relictum]